MDLLEEYRMGCMKSLADRMMQRQEEGKEVDQRTGDKAKMTGNKYSV